jgi:hypothetical protein
VPLCVVRPVSSDKTVMLRVVNMCMGGGEELEMLCDMAWESCVLVRECYGIAAVDAGVMMPNSVTAAT